MDALFLFSTDGGRELEVDRCGECGSLCFDAGELEMAANLHARPSDAESEYPCPVCRQRMLGANLPRNLFAHFCDSCRGTFLDAATLAALKNEKLPVLPEGKRQNPGPSVSAAPGATRPLPTLRATRRTKG